MNSSPIFNKAILPPIMWVTKKIFGAIYGIWMWLYDKVFSPIMKLLGLKDPAKDVKDMTERELRVEQGRLKREETGKFRHFSQEERKRQEDSSSLFIKEFLQNYISYFLYGQVFLLFP